jgi:hypothetical protein
MMDIMSGINSTPVILLLQSLSKDFDTSKIESFQQRFSELMITHNASAYRKLLATTALPCIPFLGTMLRDLTVLEENPNWLESGGIKLINFSKRRMVSKQISALLKYQVC